MKKIVITILSAIAFLSILVVYSLNVGLSNQSKCVANYIFDRDGTEIGINYDNRKYYEWNYVYQKYIDSDSIYDWSMSPYQTVDVDNPTDGDNVMYVSSEDFLDYVVFFDNEFCYFSQVFDENKNFIVSRPKDSSLSCLCVDENFVFPTLENNVVNEIWFSLSNDDIMYNPDWVRQVVESAKSNGEKELDKEIYDYIVENSWDNHCIYLKYEGYPLVEEFFVTETEDGRYIVDQYTAEEYDTIYYDEH